MKRLQVIVVVVSIAALLVLPAAGPVASAQAGTILDGQINYSIVEIQGDALDSRLEQATSRSDFGPLLEFAQSMGFVKESMTAYNVALQYQGEASSDGKIVSAQTLDMLLKAVDGNAQAHAKFYVFVDTIISGLVTYEDKENGYQIIRLYQVVDGNVRLVQSIDTQFQPLGCAEQTNITAYEKGGDVGVSSTGTCFGCHFACGTVVALGCGAGLLMCTAQPWICVALYWFCAGGYYYDCQQFCYNIDACP